MGDHELYGIYMAVFPFMEESQYKTRPVIVVSKFYGDHGIFAAIPLTSKSIAESVDVGLKNWSKAGLSRPSTARVHRLATLQKSRLGLKLGGLSTADQQKIKTALRNYLGLDVGG